MAIWQYTFQVLTKESFESLPKGKLLSTEEYVFDDEQYWKFKPIDKSVFCEIGQFLEKGKSWSKEIDLYGFQDSNCLEVFFNIKTQIVTSVSFRLDFTSNYSTILQDFIEFCILKGFIILDELLQVVPLNYELLRNTIESSPQVRKFMKLKEQSPE